ncbi:unnamed protein product [Lactuca saligna]|uniref:Uncharacterized protein n=1 Tax=Lactuca saligna TaxID=75948 RepID=A0AA36EI31_LACSI|nr:unnamed protein product [Lactuca saligna]
MEMKTNGCVNERDANLGKGGMGGCRADGNKDHCDAVKNYFYYSPHRKIYFLIISLPRSSILRLIEKIQLLRKGNQLLKSIHIEIKNLWKSKYKRAKKTAQKGVSGKVWCCCEFEVLLATHISLYKVIFIEKTKVESWRKALVDASNISGWEPQHIANGHEAKGIKQIVLEISQRLQPVTSSLDENLIGMAARLQDLKLELEIGSGGVRMVGIWGVGGGEMGHYIVRGENPNNPEKHSRVWKREDVWKICSMDATTELDMIEAIRLEFGTKGQLQRYKHLPPIVANTKNLRWIEWEGDLASPLLSNFPQRTLRHLVLYNSLQKQLWEGYKLLPNLKTIELWDLDNLIMTPDFEGLPNLETFKLAGCSYLEEIHQSMGCLERLVFLSVGSCWRLKMFPPITRVKKLETLTFFDCPELFKISEIQPNMENLPLLHLDDSGNEVASYIESCPNLFFVICWRCGCSNLPGVECCVEEPSLPHNNMKPCLRDNNMKHIGLTFFPKDLRNLNLSYCNLGDEEISSAVYCKWLWHVSLKGENKLCDGDLLLDSMLQGNAIEDHFINISLQHQIPKVFVGRLFRGTTLTLHLPDDLYNFCGFLVCLVTKIKGPDINIIMKQEVDEDSVFGRIMHEPNEATEPEYEGTKTYRKLCWS